MRLGTQTASLVNHIQSRAVVGQPEPAVGMGATVLAWTDRYPGTIICVDRGKQMIVTVQEDAAKRVDGNGMSESQRYEFAPNADGRVWHFRRAGNGMWQEVHRDLGTRRWRKVDGAGLRIGERDKYYDFSF